MRARVVMLAGIGIVATSALLTAGPLDPPAGPVSSSYKTLTEVEPRIAINATNTPGDADSVYKIALAGSYYLTGPVLGTTGKSAIEITASNVTIDLGGYSLTSLTNVAIIRVTNTSRSNITIRNGNLGAAIGAGGIDLRGTGGISTWTTGGLVENIHMSGIAGEGIRLGHNFRVQGCSVSNAAGQGYSAGGGCTFSDCGAYTCDSSGFKADDAACTFINCTSNSNGLNGFMASHASFTGCVAASNHGSGFNSTDSSFMNCAASDNNDGFFLATCRAENCLSDSNLVDGYYCSGSTMIACTAKDNDLLGFYGGDYATIINCIADGSGEDGIVSVSGGLIQGNSCHYNGRIGTGAGIDIRGGDNRIEGNSCTGADFGILVEASGNIVMRNTCSGGATANWSIVANNSLAPIITTSKSASAVNGNSYSGSLGSTDPNANFTY